MNQLWMADLDVINGSITIFDRARGVASHAQQPQVANLLYL